VRQLGLYKTSFYSRGKDEKSKKLSAKSSSVLIHPSPNIETPYTKHPYLPPLLCRVEQFLWSLKL
jgi:hypothetical protein